MLRTVPGLGTCLIADRDYVAGEVVMTAGGRVDPVASVYSIQIDAGVHVETEGPLRYTAHSCEPNTKVVWDTDTAQALCAAYAAAAPGAEPLRAAPDFIRLVALGPIAADAIVSFDYCTSEWDMAVPFTCSCGASKCRGSIGGFKPLAATELPAAAALLGSTTPFIHAAAVAAFPGLSV